MIKNISLAIILLPLLGALFAGLLSRQISRRAAHTMTILGVGTAFVLSLYLAKLFFVEHLPPQNLIAYLWASSGSFQVNIGFLLDHLSVAMMLIVTSISLLVHIYSIGYMHDDPGYQRFFSYISLFTFFMLLLVMSNNFLLLFVGWEGVGLASYLLIGFWFTRESAVQGSLKAFLVNRVGDFGFVLGIGAVLAFFGTLDYAAVFDQVAQIHDAKTTLMLFPGVTISVITLICLLLFIGAMGKSAQVPLHVWLPESMEGPTPISALIHAATMVTAGIYMVARMSPLFERSPVALSVMLIIGATGALFMGILAVVQNDIKRVVAYSTLSQLGYMVAALGASAFAASIFHLFTHAFFKALLFLAAGSVIIAMHHEQNLHKMGGLRKYMPMTYITFLIGSLALAGVPPFAGFFSKEIIIDAIKHAQLPGATYAYACVLSGVFMTALYSFRAFILAFHGQERMSQHTREHLHESPIVVCLPLICLAIPSVILGFLLIEPILFSQPGLLGSAIFVLPEHDVLARLAAHFDGAWNMVIHAFYTLPFWLAITGIFTAWLCYVRFPQLPVLLSTRFPHIYQILLDRYGFDRFNNKIFVHGSAEAGQMLYQYADLNVIDAAVNGSGRIMNRLAKMIRHLQSGYLYHYAFVMVLGLFAFLCWLLLV